MNKLALMCGARLAKNACEVRFQRDGIDAKDLRNFAGVLAVGEKRSVMRFLDEPLQ